MVDGGGRRPRPPKKPWTAFGPTDRTPLDAAAVVAGAEASRARLQATHASLEKYRRDGGEDPPDDPDHPHPEIATTRAEQLVPFLLIRSFPGDIGARPIDPANPDASYRSPDILIAVPLPPGSAPDPDVRDRAEALDPAFRSRIRHELTVDTDYDVWVHVWNLGRSAAYGVRVRGWLQAWGSPPPGKFVGGRRVDLGDRTKDTSHRLVRVGQVQLNGYDYAGFWATAESLTDVSQGSSTEALTSPNDSGTGRYDDPFQDRHTAYARIDTISPP